MTYPNTQFQDEWNNEIVHSVVRPVELTTEMDSSFMHYL
jgi:hypothetical protein